MNELVMQLVQVGAVGVICAILIMQNRESYRQMCKRLEELDNTLIRLVENNTRAMQMSADSNRLMTEELRRRSCLLTDEEVRRRVREDPVGGAR